MSEAAPSLGPTLTLEFKDALRSPAWSEVYRFPQNGKVSAEIQHPSSLRVVIIISKARIEPLAGWNLEPTEEVAPEMVGWVEYHRVSGLLPPVVTVVQNQVATSMASVKTESSRLVPLNRTVTALALLVDIATPLYIGLFNRLGDSGEGIPSPGPDA